MAADVPEDRWLEGEGYDRYMGRWSRLVAERFVSWLAPKPDGRWLEVGSGTGALTSTIEALASPKSITAVEPSETFRRHAREHVTSSSVRFLDGDAQRLPPGEYDFVVSGLVLNFLPDPEEAVRRFAAVIPGGGTVAAYVWDYAEGMEFLRIFWDEAVALDDSAAALDEGRRFPICAPEPLERAFAGAGLVDVEVSALTIETVFANFEDFWLPFTNGPGPAPGYVASLAPESSDRLREALRARLVERSDGSIALEARAWAVRGRRMGGSEAASAPAIWNSGCLCDRTVRWPLGG